MRFPAISFVLCFLGGVACSSSADPAATADDAALTSADDLVGAYSVDLSQAAFSKVRGLFVVPARAADGSHGFFADVSGSDHAVRLRGRISANATSVTFVVDRGDPALAALPTVAVTTGTDTPDRIVGILDGTWSVKEGAGGFTISRGNFGWDAYGVPFAKVASWCTSISDCDAEGIAHPACGGAWTCGDYTNLCTFTCRPVVAPGDLRIRIAATIPADGSIFMPVWIDTKTDGAAAANLEVVLDRPDAGVVGAAEFTGVAGALGGWRTPFEARFHLRPCDARKSASCAGPVTLSVRQVGDPTVLAQATVQLVAPTDDLPVAACLGGGNVVSVAAIETADGGYVVVPRTFGNLAWSAGSYINAYAGETVQHHYANFMTSYPHANFTDIVDNLEIEWDNEDAASLVPSDGFSVQYGHWAIAQMVGSKLRIDELVLGMSGAVQRATFAWDVVDALGSPPLHLRGCMHYDASAPTLAFP
jgi:hypothetical protein